MNPLPNLLKVERRWKSNPSIKLCSYSPPSIYGVARSRLPKVPGLLEAYYKGRVKAEGAQFVGIRQAMLHLQNNRGTHRCLKVRPRVQREDHLLGPKF